MYTTFYNLVVHCSVADIQQLYMMQIVHCSVANVSNKSADFDLCTLSFSYALARKQFVKDDFKTSHIYYRPFKHQV